MKRIRTWHAHDTHPEYRRDQSNHPLYNPTLYNPSDPQIAFKEKLHCRLNYGRRKCRKAPFVFTIVCTRVCTRERKERQREEKSWNGDISGGWGTDRAKWRTWQAYQATNNKAHFDSFVDRTRCFQDLYETRRSSTNQTNRKSRTRETYLEKHVCERRGATFMRKDAWKIKGSRIFAR